MDTKTGTDIEKMLQPKYKVSCFYCEQELANIQEHKSSDVILHVDKCSCPEFVQSPDLMVDRIDVVCANCDNEILEFNLLGETEKTVSFGTDSVCPHCETGGVLLNDMSRDELLQILSSMYDDGIKYDPTGKSDDAIREFIYTSRFNAANPYIDDAFDDMDKDTLLTWAKTNGVYDERFKNMGKTEIINVILKYMEECDSEQEGWD